MRDEQAYFHRRAEAELRMARRVSGPEATRAHYALAGHYLNIAFGGEPAAATPATRALAR